LNLKSIFNIVSWTKIYYLLGMLCHSLLDHLLINSHTLEMYILGCKWVCWGSYVN